MRVVLASVLIALTVLSACSKKQDNADAQQAQKNAQLQKMTPEQVRSPDRVLVQTSFICSDKTQFTVQFKSDQAGIVIPHKDPIILMQQVVASGFSYKNAQYELRGKGRDATLTVIGRKPLSCRAK